MRIKTKVRLGVVFLFTVIISIGGLGLYYLSKLAGDAENILENNYESLEYTKAILKNCDSLFVYPLKAKAAIEKNLQLQEQNITEPGEQEATVKLRQAFEKLKNDGPTQLQISAIRKACLDIQDLNMAAIVKKNQITQKTASNASTYVIFIVTVFSLIAFTFIINFPGYKADPISKLSNSIKSIAKKKLRRAPDFRQKG